MNRFKLLTVLGAFAMLLPLPVMQYIGEESYYTIGAYEIYATGEYWHQWILGASWPKTPFYNWLIIFFSQIIGWDHLDVAARLVSVLASFGSAGCAWFMSRRLFSHNPNAPWIASAIYLGMGEISFWYGWLGYADATFGFFIFSAIIALWIAIEEEKAWWMLLSAILISLAFFTKNISCYYFYGVSALTLLHRQRKWYLLKQPWFTGIGIISLLPPWLYQEFVLHGGSNNSTVAINDALRHFGGFEGFSIWSYLGHVFSYPLEFAARAFPLPLFFAWLFWIKRARFEFDKNIITVCIVLLLCIAPFWFSVSGSPRYLVPLYGFMALILTGLIQQVEKDELFLAFKIMAAVLIIKVPYSFGILPYIKDLMPERDMKVIAEEIHQKTKAHVLRSVDDVSTGLSIAAYIDVMRPKDKYIRQPLQEDRNVYIISDYLDPKLGEIVAHYQIRGNQLYLYWKK